MIASLLGLQVFGLVNFCGWKVVEKKKKDFSLHYSEGSFGEEEKRYEFHHREMCPMGHHYLRLLEE